MKKVVLLAGAIAAGMAIAPQAANAAAPELNDVQEINLSDQQISAAITTANNQIAVLEGIKASAGYAAVVDAADQTAINYAINDLKALVEQMTYIVDGVWGTNSDYFQNTGTNQGRLTANPTAAGTPDYIKRYAGAGLVQNTSTCTDVVNAAIAAVASNVAAAQAALAAHLGTMTPAEILDANATTAAGVTTTDLENILEEALDILGAYDTNYQDPVGDKSDIYDADIYGGKDGAINTKFDATVKGQIEAAKQLLERIEAAKNKDLTVDDTLDDQLLNQFELQTDVNVLTPLLEGYVVTFKIEANHVAADNLKDELTAEFANLKHHQDCKHTDTHKVADEIQATIDQLDPDATWDAELDLHKRANTDPAAVTAWEAYLNGTSVPAVTTLYKKALGWDLTDLNEAILAFEDPWKDLDDSDVKTYLKSFFYTGKTITGTIANEYAQLKADIDALGTAVSKAEFLALDQRVTDLYDRLANVEKAWPDIVKLCKDDHDLQKEIDDAKTEKGYSSTTIKNKWETGEQPELDTLEGQITDAILAIKKDAEFTGYDTFKPTITLEYDHHAWLAEYQKENYDATQTMIAAIDVRWAEYTAAKDFKITTTEKGTQTLADGTEVYTTQKNIDNGYTLETTKGEDDPSKPIYASFGDHLGFSHIDAHFTDHISGLSAAPGHDGFGTDIRYDRINKWYNDAEAQYLGSKNYVDNKWNEAERKGELINNTKEGLDVATTATDASAILVNAPAAKADVVFGWLQKEIQTTFAKAIENEKANKDIHDKRAEVEKYVADAMTFINNEAHLTINATDVPAREYDTYDMAARKDVMDPEAAYTTNSYLDFEGNYRSLKANNFKVEADLGADFYTKEAEQTAPTNTSVDYLPEFDCGHNLTETPNDHVWGWDKIGTVLVELEKLEKKEYDKVASKALLDGTTKMDLDGDSNNETFEETLAEVKENVDDITNEAFTQLYKNGLALVQQELVDAKHWAELLDAECEEHAADHPCSALDVKNNPCGWDNTGVEGDAYSMLKAIVEAWNTERALIATTDHNAETNDTVEKRDAFTAYVVKALNDIRDWKVKFAAMDKEHKIKLNAALDLAQKEALTMEHYAQEAKNAKANFSVDGADKATADNWAVDFNERKFPFVDGQEHTFVEILKVLKADIDAAHVHVTPPYADDKYAGLEEVLANGITCFDDYIKATDFVKKLSEDYAQAKYDHHLYTDLKTFADGLEKFNWQADFNKWIEANKDCHVRMETVLADLKVATDAIEIEATELYGDEYNGGVDNTTKTQLEALRTEINTLIANQKEAVLKLYKDGEAFEVKDHQPGNINAVEVLLADGETKAKYDPTAIQNKINALNTALAAAKKLYADNAAAKAKYEAELAQVKSELAAFSSEVEAEIANGKIYVKSEDVTAPKNNETVKAAVQTVTTALANEADHITNGFNAGVLAYDGAEDATDAKDNKTEVEKHLAADRDLLKAARTALVEAQALYAQNVAAKLEKQAQLENLKRDLKEFVVAAGTVYSTVTYTGDKTNWTKEALEGVITTQAGVVTTALGDLEDAFNAGTAPAFVVPATVAPALDQALKDLEAAKKYYADNVAAKDRLLLEVAAVVEANGLVVVDLNNTAMYAADKALITNAEGTGLEEQFLAAVAVEKGNPAAETAAEKLGHFGVEFNAGTIAANEGEEMKHVQGLIAQNAAIADAILKAANHYAEEHALFDEYSEKVNNLETLRDALTTTVWAVYDDIVLDKDGAALNAEVQAINNAILAERQALKSDVEVGTVKAHAADYVDAATGEDVVGHDNAIDAIESLIQTLEEHIAEYEKFYADEHAEANKYNDKVNNLETLRDALTTTVWAVYDDIENGKDGAALNAEVKAITEAIYAERAALDTDLLEGNVQAHATTDYTVEEDGVIVEKKAHETAIDAIESLIQTLEEHIADYEKFYADEHKLADKYNDELNNLETLRDALGTVWNAYDTLEDLDKTDKTLAALRNDWLAISEALAAERADVAADLEAGNVQAHATTDYTVEEDGVIVEKKAHETAINNIAEAIKKLQDKVRDIEQFKAENKEKAAELTNDLTNLLAVLEGMHKYGDVYPEDKLIIDYLLDNADIRAEVPEGVKAAVLGLVEQVKAEVANVADDLENGRVVDNYENYKDAIGYIKTDIENLKKVIAEAETLYAENLDAWNKLDTHTTAIRTTINELEANSKCADCDEADNQALEDAKKALENIANAYTSRFNVEKDLNDGRVYMGFEGDLNGVEETVKGIKKDMQDHFDLVRTSQKATDNVLDKMLDFEFILSEAQALEGADNFLEKDPENCNQDVLYFDEIRQAIADLKADILFDNSHEGGHQAFANYNAYIKQIQAIKDQIKTLEAAIAANNAAHELIKAQYAEIEGLVGDAMDFFNEYYMEKTNDEILPELQEWIGVATAGEPGVAPSFTGGKLNDAMNTLHNDFEHGSAAYKWTVDAQGQEFTDAVKADVETQKFDIESMRNNAAKFEALNHIDLVQGDLTEFVETYITAEQYVGDPFVAELLAEYKEKAEGIQGDLDLIETQVQEEWRGRTLEEALNIDEHSKIAGIHQALEALNGNVDALAVLEVLYADAHHLTNGKTIFSDQYYYTIGFFRKANEGGQDVQGQEMFKTVTINRGVEDGIGIYDAAWTEGTGEYEDVFGTPDNEWDDVPVQARDERGYLIHQDGIGLIPADVEVLVNGSKKNEIAFENPVSPLDLERETLLPGAADITFRPGSITVDGWTTKHNVYIEVQVAVPDVEEGAEVDGNASSNKLVVRLQNPLDVTYSINSLVAKTDKGEDIYFADRELNFSKGTVEFALPEGTEFVELPEGFFTFRTGENSIARSAAATIYVGNLTSIDTLIAMGEKAEIFDLQGRRVKAESLLSGNAYIVNGEKVMVK